MGMKSLGGLGLGSHGPLLRLLFLGHHVPEALHGFSNFTVTVLQTHCIDRETKAGRSGAERVGGGCFVGFKGDFRVAQAVKSLPVAQET